MGVHDREYYRDDADAGGRLGAPTIVVSIIVLNVALFLFELADPRVAQTLALDADVAYRPWKAYQLLTYGFVHSRDIFHIVFNMLNLYVFGRDVEERFGKKIFLGFYLIAVVLSGLAWVAWQALFQDWNAGALGASGAVAATAIAFCTLWPRREMALLGLIRMPAWGIAALLVGIDMLNAFGATPGADGAARIAWQAHLGGAAFGFAFARWSPAFLPRLRAATGFSVSRWWRARKLRVYQEAEADAERRFGDLESRADDILSKLKAHGDESLTSHERRTLEDYSRHVRQRRR